MAVPAESSAFVAEYTASPVDARIPAYRLREDLSDVANLKQFPQLAAVQKKQLGTLGFVAQQTNQVRIDEPYLAAEKQQLPVFVTADAALVAVQRWSEDTWRRVQADSLPALLSAFTLTMLQRSQEQVETAPAGEMQEAAVRNVAYFGVAAGLLGLDISVAPGAAELIRVERERIAAAKETATCGATTAANDYTVFAPPAGEAPPERLWAMRQALQWYRSAVFPLHDSTGRTNTPVEGQVLLWVDSLAREPGAPLASWAAIADSLAWFEGRGPGHLADAAVRAARQVFGDTPTLASYRSYDSLEQFAEVLSGSERLSLLPAAARPDEPLLKEFRIAVEHPLCNGLQLMAGFGLPRAVQLVDQVYRLPAHDPKYSAMLERLGEMAGEVSEDTMRADLRWGKLWAMAPLNDPAPAGRPQFCASNAWYDRCLATTLASWVDWRHEPWLATPGEPEALAIPAAPVQPPIGYVEPCPDLFRRLRYLAVTTTEGLSAHGLLNGASEDSGQRLVELLEFLETVAAKEIGNESLVATEQARLATIGHELGWFASGLDATLWATAERLPRVSYLPVAEGLDLECGVGPVMRVLVVVPDGGKFYLAVGGLTSYVERLREAGKRLDDAAWEKLFDGGSAPPLPEWCGSFVQPAPHGPGLFEAPERN